MATGRKWDRREKRVEETLRVLEPRSALALALLVHQLVVFAWGVGNFGLNARG